MLIFHRLEPPGNSKRFESNTAAGRAVQSFLPSLKPYGTKNRVSIPKAY
jgi:hypothetical protein